MGRNRTAIEMVLDRHVEITPGVSDRLREEMERRDQFTPVVRFTLRDEAERIFTVEHMTYSGDGGWMDLHSYGSIDMLARAVIPKLGTDAFFELY